jgi:hypothetical protein
MGKRCPTDSHVIKNGADLAISFVSWAQSGKPEGALKQHFLARAQAIGDIAERFSRNREARARRASEKLALWFKGFVAPLPRQWATVGNPNNPDGRRIDQEVSLRYSSQRKGGVGLSGSSPAPSSFGSVSV